MIAAKRFVLVSLGCVAVGAWAAKPANATTDCVFTFRGGQMTLRADCTTDATIMIPDGFTLDGRNHTITAVDPPASNGIKGAVIRNAGARASVRNLRIDTNNLGTFCDPGEDKLRGISLVGASGFVVDNEILNINQADGGDGCQEGTGIEAVNSGDDTTGVRIERNVIQAYQKLGINVSGNVRAEVRRNEVQGLGPVNFIAQIGIQIAGGADANVEENLVSGNEYTGPQAVQSVGILVVGGPTVFTTGVRIQRNAVTENDDGIFLDNANAAGNGADTPTRNVVQDNFVSKAAVTNGNRFQIGIIDVGNRDRIIGNVIAGAGYDPAANPGAQVAAIFAEPLFAIDPVVRRNRIIP
jgi:hypothetical protein